MFPKIDSATTVRIALLSLSVTFVFALSGRAGLRMSADSEHDRFVTGGYQGDETLAVKVVRADIVAVREVDRRGGDPSYAIYDSAAGSISTLTQRAVKDGARLVIGPLQKPAVKNSRARPNCRCRSCAGPGPEPGNGGR